jgi:NAD(P)-dependent dehydrogenase (short-subunit alcohol dehydrogenase family)
MSSLYASKSGVTNLTRRLASEWGKRGVNVNSLAPGVFTN